MGPIATSAIASPYSTHGFVRSSRRMGPRHRKRQNLVDRPACRATKAWRVVRISGDMRRRDEEEVEEGEGGFFVEALPDSRKIRRSPAQSPSLCVGRGEEPRRGAEPLGQRATAVGDESFRARKVTLSLSRSRPFSLCISL